MARARQRRARAATTAVRHVAPAPAASADVGARVVRALLAAVLLAGALAVDPAAEASFDAPKRLLTLVGVALAAAAWLVLPGRAAPRRSWQALGALQRAALVLAGVALAGAITATLASPRGTVSVPALRAVLVTALLLPLGASRALDGSGATMLLGAFLAGTVVDAIASLLDRAGMVQLFTVEAVAGRATTGAFVGNEGSLALLLALGAVASLAAALQVRAPAWRTAALAALAAQGVALAVNPSLTALLALLAGAAVVSLAALERRALLVLPALALLLGVAVVAYAPLRARVVGAAAAARAGDWDALLTYRLGPWAAGVEMVRARPLTGYGPGTFGAEFAAHRLRAEERHRRRFVLPRETSTFAEAHCDYLQGFAEAGVLGGGAALGALALLLAGIARRATRDASVLGGSERGELVVILGLVVTGAVGALTWFPLQQAAAAPVLLLALGHGWRLLPPAASPPDASVAAAAPGAALTTARWLGAALLVLGVTVPELRRYAAERELARATQALKSFLAAPAVLVPPRLLDEVGARALASAAALPGDSRPLLAAAAADLVAKRSQQALERYRAALELGERAEIDLNAGRAFAMLDQRPEAFAAFVRAAWLSPYLIPSMPAAAQPLVEAEVARRAVALRDGTLVTPPPLPEALQARRSP